MRYVSTARKIRPRKIRVPRSSRARFYVLRVQFSPPPLLLPPHPLFNPRFVEAALNAPKECVMDLRIILDIAITIRLIRARIIFVRLLSN